MINTIKPEKTQNPTFCQVSGVSPPRRVLGESKSWRAPAPGAPRAKMQAAKSGFQGFQRFFSSVFSSFTMFFFFFLNIFFPGGVFLMSSRA